MIPNKKIILSIEGIRGFAAIYVMLGHFVQLYRPYQFFPNYEFLIKTIFGYGHHAVILFFIMSGFSIHYSSFNKDFNDKKQIGDYLFKRFRRIYPLFLISLFIALCVLYITNEQSNWIRNTLSFLLLTDISKGCIADPIPTNFPIWSLSYEAIYYLLYPGLVLLIRKFNLRVVFLLSIMISFFAAFFEFAGIQNHLSNVLQLYWIWVIGLVVAEYKLKKETIPVTYFSGLLVVSIAAMFTFEKLSLVRDWSWALFFSLIILSFFANNHPIKLSYKIINLVFSFIGLAVFYLLTYNDQVVFHPALLRYLLVVIALMALVIIFFPFHSFQSVLRWMLKPLVRTGSYSYAVYIFHWPFILLFIYLFIQNKDRVRYS